MAALKPAIAGGRWFMFIVALAAFVMSVASLVQGYPAFVVLALLACGVLCVAVNILLGIITHQSDVIDHLRKMKLSK